MIDLKFPDGQKGVGYVSYAASVAGFPQVPAFFRAVVYKDRVGFTGGGFTGVTTEEGAIRQVLKDNGIEAEIVGVI